MLTLGSYSTYRYAYKAHKEIEELNSDFTGNSIEFLEKASQNFSIWNTKIVTITGEVTSIDTHGVTLENQIYCQFKNIQEKTLIKESQNIQIKGRVIGYDDLLDELKLEQCILK